MQLVAGNGLADFEGACFIQPFGKGLGKNGRDVLDDADARQAVRQAVEHKFQRLGAAGRGAQQDDLPRIERPGTREAGRLRRGVPGRRPAQRRDRRALHPLAKLRAQVADAPGGGGFAQHVHRPGFQRIQCGTRTGLRQGADDDDGHGPVFLQNSKERQAVHARHLDVQRKHVRIEFEDFVPRLVRIGRGADDLDFRVAAKGVADGVAHDGRVVHDQHADFFWVHARFMKCSTCLADSWTSIIRLSSFSGVIARAWLAPASANTA